MVVRNSKRKNYGFRYLTAKLPKYSGKSKSALIYHSFFFLVLLTSIIINYFLYHKLYDVHKIDENLPQNTLPVKQLKLTNIPPKAMVIQNVITIEGEADENHIIGLWENGNALQVTLPVDGKFVFNNINLKRHVHNFEVRAINDSGKIIYLEKISIEYQLPTSRFLAKDFTRADIRYKHVALTFDGDYLDNLADSILTVLSKKQVPATFFLTARFIENYPFVVKRLVAEGHQVANHTWRHPHLTMFEEEKQHTLRPEVTREFVQNELVQTENIFKKVTGKPMSHFWRAPFGEHNSQIRMWASEIGYQQIGWSRDRKIRISLDTMDWVADKNSPLYRNPDEILTNVLTFADSSEYGVNGGIILMHLGSLRPDDYPSRIVGPMIDSLRFRGYEFRKIESMIFN